MESRWGREYMGGSCIRKWSPFTYRLLRSSPQSKRGISIHTWFLSCIILSFILVRPSVHSFFVCPPTFLKLNKHWLKEQREVHKIGFNLWSEIWDLWNVQTRDRRHRAQYFLGNIIHGSPVNCPPTRKWNVRHSYHKNPSIFHILSQINQFHNFLHFHFKKNFNILLSSTSRSTEKCLPFSFTNQYLLSVSREGGGDIAARHELGVRDRDPVWGGQDFALPSALALGPI